MQLATRMADSMAIQFEGLYAHERHAYQARGRQAVSELGAEAAVRLLQLAKRCDTVKDYRANTIQRIERNSKNCRLSLG